MKESRRVFLIDDYSSSKINGIGTYMTHIVYILNTLNYEVYIIAYNYPCQTACFKRYKNTLTLCVPILNIPIDRYFEIICYFIRLNVEDSETNAFVFNYIVSSILLNKMKKYYIHSKFIYTIHDMSWTSFFQGDKNLFLKIGIERILSDNRYLCMRKALKCEIDMFESVDKVIALTNTTFGILQREYGVSNPKISVIPNGILSDISCIKKKADCFSYINMNDKVLLFVGRVHKSKGIDALIDAFNLVTQIKKDIKLVILGALLPNESQYSKTKNFASNIIFRGFVEKDEVNAWYRTAYMAVFPSYYEQCSYAGLEIMSHQLPVVSSNGFCVNEMFVHNNNALIADIGDRNNPEEYVYNLKQAMISLIDDIDFSNSLARAGKIKSDTIYNIHRVSYLYKLMFEELFSH
jgi:glycosyltransferase involved in cell wall biosynthesis